MASGQTPFRRIFPALPQGFQEPFWYSSLQSLWLYYRVAPELLRERLPALAHEDGYEVALFEFAEGEPAGLASLDLQRYTAHGTSFLATADEVEFNFYVYPRVRRHSVPLMSWQDYLAGIEQTKTIGGYRLHVPCDNPVAVQAGQGLYGEPKYLAVLECTVPSLNAPPSAAWSYSVYQDLAPPPAAGQPHTAQQGPLIYTLACDLSGVVPTPASPSPLIEYGALVGEGGALHAVANFWDIWGPFYTYLLAGLDPPFQTQLTLGTEPDSTGTIDDLKLLIAEAQPVAAQVYASPPVSAESRGWYPVPAP